jgi:hypothetical protein
MPEIDLDFGGVNVRPSGWFRLTVNKAIYKSNKANDGMLINLQMQLTDMPSGTIPDTDVDYEQFEGMMVQDWPSLKPTTRWKLAKVLSAITQKDWVEDGMKLEYKCEEDCDQFSETGKCPHTKRVPLLEERTVVGLVEAGEFEGTPQMKVQRYVEDDGNVEFGPNFVE